MWPKKKRKENPQGGSTPSEGNSAEMTVHVASDHTEGNGGATATDGVETITVATVEQSGVESTEPDQKNESSSQNGNASNGVDSVRLHVNGQRENGDLSIATAGAEISTVVIVEQDGADSAEPSRQPVHEKGHLDLPSSRKLSFRRSRKTRRNIPPSNGAVVEIVVQEYEEDTEVVEQATLASNEDKAEEEAENNALPLQDRLQKQREEGEKIKKRAEVNAWAKFVYVEWPKFKKRTAAILSWKRYELWRSHMKYILGHYGSGAYSYYNFLRWLFLVNLLLALLLVSFIIIPQFVWRATEEGLAESNRRYVARTNCLRAAANCTDCEGCDPAIVINTTDSAFYANSNSSTVMTVTECSVNVAHMGLPRNVITGNFSEPDWFLCLRDECPRNIQKCINNFFSGEGLFADSELFLGWYTNTPINWPTISSSYDMPMAYLLTASVVYGLSLILIVIRIGASFQEQYTHRNVKAGKYRNLCNNFFTGWDFNITQKQLASSRHKAAKTKLHELAGDVMERGKKRSRIQLLRVILIRIFTNAFVFLSLIGGAIAIFYSVRVEIQQLENTSYLSTAVITLINLIYPYIFGLLLKMELYQKSRHAQFMSLLRLWTVRFYSYFSLLIAVTVEIECTQPEAEETGGQCSISVSIQELAGQVADGGDSSPGVCPSCWETVLGQKFYFNAIVNMAVSLLMTVGMDTLSNIVSRCKCKLPKILAVNREFGVAEGIIDLIEIQIIFWLGFFFAPMICFITLINLFLLFYVKRYSMQLNLTPSKEMYLAAKKDLAYLLILLATGLLCLLPVGYTIANLVPSSTCGPFRGLGFFYNIMDTRINELRCIEQKLVTTFLSAGFLAPLFLFLVMVIIGLGMVLRAKGTTVTLLVKQLKLESEDKNFLYDLRAQDMEGDGGTDDHYEADGSPAIELTDSPSGSPSRSKLPSSGTLVRRSPLLSTSSLHGDDSNTMSRARQMRLSQENIALGRAGMDFNQEFKEFSPGRRSPAPDRKSPAPDRKSPAPDRKSPAPDRKSPAPDRKSPAPDRKSPAPDRKSPAPDRKSPAPDRKSPAPNRKSSPPDRKSSPPDRKSSTPGVESSTLSDGDDLSDTVGIRPVKEAVSNGGLGENAKEETTTC